MKKLIPVYVRVPIIFFAVFGAMEFFIDSGDRPAFIKFPMVAVFLFVFLFLLIAIEITVSAIDKITYQLLTEEQKAKLVEVSQLSFKESQWYTKLVKALTKSEPIENEGELLLDHDYDGIKELDNNSDVKGKDINDNFFDDLYSNFNIQRVDARRSINANPEKRGSLKELLINNYSNNYTLEKTYGK